MNGESCPLSAFGPISSSSIEPAPKTNGRNKSYAHPSELDDQGPGTGSDPLGTEQSCPDAELSRYPGPNDAVRERPSGGRGVGGAISLTNVNVKWEPLQY